MSPQIHDKSRYTSKCDIWSLGVILHQLVYKCDPYKAKDIDDLRTKLKTIQPGVFKMSSNEGMIGIIKGCLAIEESQRLSWE